MESKPFLPQMNTGSQQNDSVKKNVQNNEPQVMYQLNQLQSNLQIMHNILLMPDVAFYAPKEIYKNQKT
jgi:hypothetical protein